MGKATIGKATIGKGSMKIILDFENNVPIYEQIETQIKRQILNGSLKSGEALPSIRILAKELKIGIITAKRAYDDLINQGYAYSVQGKGVYVSGIAKDVAIKHSSEEIVKSVKKAIVIAKASGISKEDFIAQIEAHWTEV
jgi:GntR family transcriptional regulator